MGLAKRDVFQAPRPTISVITLLSSNEALSGSLYEQMARWRRVVVSVQIVRCMKWLFRLQHSEAESKFCSWRSIVTVI